MTGSGRSRRQFIWWALVLVALAMVIIAAEQATAGTPPDNFEWTPSALASDYEFDEYPRELLVDRMTGDVVLINTLYKLDDEGQQVKDGMEVLRFDSSTYSFEHHMYMPLPSMEPRNFLAYDGHIYYTLYDYGTGRPSLGVDTSTSTFDIGYAVDKQNLRWALFDTVAANGTHVTILCQMVYRQGGSYYPPYDYVVDLISVDLSDHNSTVERILTSTERIGQYSWVDVHGEELRVLYMGTSYQPSRFYVFRYDMGTGSSIGPFNFYNQTLETSYYGRPVFGQNGKVHIWWADLGPLLISFDKDFGYIDEMSLDGLIPDPVTPSFGIIPVAINETGELYILYYTRMTNYIRALIVSGDYSGHRYMNVTDGDFESWTIKSAIDGDGRLLIAWIEPCENYGKTAFVYQAPLSPDLEVDPSSFRFTEDPEAEKNIELGFRVENIGRAPAEGYWVYVLIDDMNEGGQGQPRGFYVDDILEAGGNVSLSDSMNLLKGNHHVRLAIRSVSPRELWTDNNVFDAWIYVNTDRPPVLEVFWPHDGMFVDDEVYFEGVTTDREDPDTVTTQVHVPGKVVETMTGSGPWDVSVDASDLTSGVYVLLIIASDGTNEVRVGRTINVDHPGESLWVEAFSPVGVPELLVGDGLAFTFEARDLFGRAITYQWTLDGETVAEATTSYPYISREAGTFVLRAEAANTYHTVFHEWNITVREPVAPSLVLVSPEGDLVLHKGDDVRFEVEITNPDLQPYSIVWLKDNAPMDTSSGLKHSMLFERSGEHSARVLLTSSHGTDHVTWSIVVVNRAPHLSGSSPEGDTVDITGASTIAFSVLAEDPDKDPLTYEWSSSLLDLSGMSSRQCTLDLPCDDDEPYTIRVTVSDGEDAIVLEWTVLPDLPEPPVNHGPTLVSMTPPDGIITIHEDTDIDFAVLAKDMDGDVLSYIWGSSLVELQHRNESGYLVTCPCTQGGEYTVYVVVSDGEKELRTEWTIIADPVEKPPDMKNGGLPYVVVLAIIVTVSALALAYAYWSRRGRSEG